METPIVEQDFKVDYLKLNGKVFAIKEVEGEVDVEAELKEFYREKNETLIKDLTNAVRQENFNDWSKQIEHINTASSKDNVTVPKDMFDKKIMVKDRQIWELRTVLYSPKVCKTTLGYLHRVCGVVPEDGSSTSKRFALTSPAWKGLKKTPTGDVIIIEFNNAFVLPVTYAYSKKLNLLYTPFERTYHTYDSGKVCTGNGTAQKFWESSSFEALVNEINMCSLASSVMTNHNDFTVNIKNLITPESVVKVTKRKETKWKI